MTGAHFTFYRPPIKMFYALGYADNVHLNTLPLLVHTLIFHKSLSPVLVQIGNIFCNLNLFAYLVHGNLYFSTLL